MDTVGLYRAIIDAHPALFSVAASADPTTILINYGALGIMLVFVMTGQFRTKSEVQNLQRQIEDYREIIRGFQAQANQAVPALARSAQVLEAIPNKEAGVLEEIRQAEQRMVALVARLEAASGDKP
jgi:type II secretory pathway pseudopilin PulG